MTSKWFVWKRGCQGNDITRRWTIASIDVLTAGGAGAGAIVVVSVVFLSRFLSCRSGERCESSGDREIPTKPAPPKRSVKTTPKRTTKRRIKRLQIHAVMASSITVVVDFLLPYVRTVWYTTVNSKLFRCFVALLFCGHSQIISHHSLPL